MLGLLIFFLAVCFATQLRPTSIEKEIFPKMAQDDNLFAFDLSGRCTVFIRLTALGAY